MSSIILKIVDLRETLNLLILSPISTGATFIIPVKHYKYSCRYAQGDNNNKLSCGRVIGGMGLSCVLGVRSEGEKRM